MRPSGENEGESSVKRRVRVRSLPFPPFGPTTQMSGLKCLTWTNAISPFLPGKAPDAGVAAANAAAITAVRTRRALTGSH